MPGRKYKYHGSNKNYAEDTYFAASPTEPEYSAPYVVDAVERRLHADVAATVRAIDGGSVGAVVLEPILGDRHPLAILAPLGEPCSTNQLEFGGVAVLLVAAIERSDYPGASRKNLSGVYRPPQLAGSFLMSMFSS